MPEIVAHLESVVGAVENPPILIGHSAGGVFTQLLLDRGYGASAVVLNSAPTEGVKVAPVSQLKSTFPVLKSPGNRHKAVGFTFEQFHYAFTNGVDEAIARPLYERYAVPATAESCSTASWPTSSPATRTRGSTTTTKKRAPLLFISGSTYHIMPPERAALQREALQGQDHGHRDLRV